MTNSDSCGNETPTGGTTTELDVRGITDAAKILIERMKIKPEEFTPGNKFGHIWAACWQRVNPEPHTGAPPPVPLRDAEVLLAAYDKYITEPEFTQHVLETVFADDTELPGALRYEARNRYTAGVTDPRGFFGAVQPPKQRLQSSASIAAELNNILAQEMDKAWFSGTQEKSE